jgi:hypothetical protein
MMDDEIQSRYREVRELADEIVRRLHGEVMKLGFAASEVRIRQPDEADFRLERDPSTSEYALVGDWFDEHGGRLGGLLFHADGSFYAEHDVVRPHPAKRCWFVEAVNAWGKGARIKSEARLLPMPS